MSLEIRLLSYKGNGTQGERIVRTTFRGKIEFTALTGKIHVLDRYLL